jgi:hypothetical protein
MEMNLRKYYAFFQSLYNVYCDVKWYMFVHLLNKNKFKLIKYQLTSDHKRVILTGTRTNAWLCRTWYNRSVNGQWYTSNVEITHGYCVNRIKYKVMINVQSGNIKHACVSTLSFIQSYCITVNCPFNLINIKRNETGESKRLFLVDKIRRWCW